MAKKVNTFKGKKNIVKLKMFFKLLDEILDEYGGKELGGNVKIKHIANTVESYLTISESKKVFGKK